MRSYERKNENGFSLIELLIVVTIIGILTTLGTRQFGTAIDKSKATADFTNAQSLASAIVQALADNKLSGLTRNTSDGKGFVAELTPGSTTISGTADTIQEILKDADYYDTIPQIKGKSNAKWGVLIPKATGYSAEVYIVIDSAVNEAALSDVSKAIKLYPRLDSYTGKSPYDLVND